ncbi:MAG: glycosyltransferase family 4 protein [Actinobacteria bacterium]|nr:glycosyltransferase family 4 protein [Actinomycetota bacterium]
MVTNYRAKIVHVSTVGITGTKLLLPQCTYFREKGFEISFVFSPGPEAQILRERGFTVKEIKIERAINPLQDLISIRSLRNYFCQLRPDIVHTHTSKAGLAGRLSAWLSGVPVIVHTVHGFPFHEGMPRVKTRLYQTMEKLGASLSTAILTQSKEDIDNADRLGIRSKTGDLIHIGNGVDTNEFNPKRFTKERQLDIKRKLGLKPGTLVLTTIARVNPLKGYGDLIGAVAKLPKGDWQLLCVGEDEGQEAKIKNKIKQLSLGDKVNILGKRDDIAEILSVSDIYILASYREGIPRSAIEAQAMEIPAVVTNVRGSREVVVDGQTGFIIPPHEPEILAGAIGKLMENAEIRIKFGKAGRRRVLEEFNENKVFERIMREYERLLVGKGYP